MTAMKENWTTRGRIVDFGPPAADWILDCGDVNFEIKKGSNMVEA